MKKWSGELVQELAETYHGYSIAKERASELASEINGYLETVNALSVRLAFDDAPSDFDPFLVSESSK